jgi:eukaryotic-like serine/threonine-protein kinase
MSIRHDGDTTTDAGLASPRRPNAAVGLRAGTTVHRYVVIGELGRGGMGTVYAAWDPELGRRVAIKLLHRFEGAAAVARIVAEARALARLRHANVVAVHDIGHIGDRMFLAMDFVEGTTLGRWLLRARSRAETLAVLLQAGRGLLAAHQAGLVHRDFKPDNVLVESTPNGPLARVIDFGIAIVHDVHTRAAGSRAGDSHTHRAGTPAYMAPEVHLGHRGDAKSDQWSFAKVCVEALAPHRSGASPIRAAHELGALRRPLVRALAEDPSDRHRGMATLLDTLEGAHGRRRPLAMAALLSGGLALGLVAVARGDATCTGGATAMEATWNDDRRARLAQLLDDVMPEDSRARTVATAAVDTWSVQWATVHDEVCASVQIRRERSPEFLDLSMQCLEHQRIRVDELLDATDSLDAEGAWKLVDVAVAIPTPDECRAPAAQPLDGPEVATIRSNLARARALLELGRMDAALTEVRAARDRARELAVPLVEAECLALEGEIAFERGDPQARATLVRATELAIEHDAPALAAQALTTRTTLAGMATGGEADAAFVGELAPAFLARADDPSIEARHEYALSRVARTQQRYADARGHCRRAYDLSVELGDAGTRLRWNARLCEADLAVTLGDAPTATTEFAGLQAEIEARFGPGHPMLIGVHSARARLEFELGELERAAQAYADALSICERVYGAGHARSIKLLGNLAMVDGARGRRGAERARLHQVVAGLEAIHGPRHPDVATAYGLLATSHLFGREFPQARELAERALAALGERTEFENNRAVALQTIGLAWIGEGEHARAVSPLRRALLHHERALGPTHAHVAFDLVLLAECEVAERDFASALELLARAQEIEPAAAAATSTLGEVRLQLVLSKALHEGGRGTRRDQVLAHAQRARELAEQARGAVDDVASARAAVDEWLAELARAP